MADLQTYRSFTVSSAIRESYDVHFLDNLKELIDVLSQHKGNVFIIDQKVADLFSAELASILSGCRTVMITVDEHNKTMDYAQLVIEKLIQVNIRKNDSLVAFGGGITQDIVAFISSILFRGVDWKFIPSTLLSQCDSCIGSKSSINFKLYKNLIGTFNPPSEIYISPVFLSTLPEAEIRSGIGEMLHYFLTEGIELAREVSDKFELLLTDRTILPYFISNSLRIKKAVIEVDEFDTSRRHIFNYGHTFGHAIEAITNYSIPHGQAVSIGMDLANYISFKLGMLSHGDFRTMQNILKKNIPPFLITEANIEEYCIALSKDKKNKGNQLGCILSRRPGEVEKVFIDVDESFKEIILSYFKESNN